MKKELVQKYQPNTGFVTLPGRKWPDNKITRPPKWCSVDLRDGNQALIIPMNIEEKLELFQKLVSIGFKEIEIGFPSASDIEFKFLRTLIEKKLIPDDVTIQVLTQAREHLIKKTLEALQGANRAIVHVYNSTSVLQRSVVFNKSREEIKQIAVEGVKLVKELSKASKTRITLEYSPESFTGTETEYALEVCEAVMQAWESSEERKVILNLPATVEMFTPNIYADQIEWFITHIKNRTHAIISLHAHNDRGTAVAATELALMAGADRVEGTLFGNGERTGNVDLITLALNMYSQGLDPELDFHDINSIIDLSEKVTRIPVHMRHPYAGELVYTAFSGSHQDAINKGIDAMKKDQTNIWQVPYLPIDPDDLGRTYESIIRINSQSGKGGVAYIMEKNYGFQLPKKMHTELGPMVQSVADMRNEEILPERIFEIFQREYLNNITPFEFISFKDNSDEQPGRPVTCSIQFKHNGALTKINGTGNGPIDACKNAFIENKFAQFKILSYNEHSLEAGSDAQAVAYIQIEKDNQQFFGAGVDNNIEIASIKALFCALNRSFQINK